MRRILVAIAAGFSFTGALAVGPLMAQPAAADIAGAKTLVDAAKAKGVVGELGTGFLGFVTASTDNGLKGAVDTINAGRAAAYKSVAAKTGVSEAAAGQAAAQQVVARLAPGSYYKPLEGSWTRK